LYRDVKRECLEPFKEKARIYPDYAQDHQQRAEIKKIVTCTENYLSDYIKFATGNMDDQDVDKLHRMVTKGLEKAIETKKKQYQKAYEELDDAERELEDIAADVCDVNSEAYDKDDCDRTLEKLRNIKAFREQLKNAEKEDISLMTSHLEKVCKVAETRSEKASCIDGVFYMAHNRGTLLPLMCGAPLEEYVHQAVWGEDVEESDPIGNVAVCLAKDTQDVLTCIRNYGYNKAHYGK
jgi:Skp family chaperone for outer membrane proteins